MSLILFLLFKKIEIKIGIENKQIETKGVEFSDPGLFVQIPLDSTTTCL